MFAVGIDPKEYQDSLQDEPHGGGAMVEQFCTDMTARAEEGKLDPVIGREAGNVSSDGDPEQKDQEQSVSGRRAGCR